MSRIRLFYFLSVFLMIYFDSFQSFAFDYIINDFKFYPVPNIQRPQKGVTIQDPVFHTDIIRITDSLTETPNSTAGNLAQPGYPKHDIENADGTRLIIQTYGGSGWAIYNANLPYNFIQWIPTSLIGWSSAIDARWDRQDPDVLYYIYDKKIMKYRVSTNSATILHDFRAEYPGEFADNPYCNVTMMEEGDSSDDSRYWAFNVHCRDYKLADPWGPEAYKAIIVYDKDFYGKDSGKVISTLKREDPKWRLGTFASMSPSGKYVWIGDHHYIYPRDFSSGPRDLGICCHADMAISAEGREVVFGFAMKYPENQYYAAMVDIETGELTHLAGPIGAPDYHFSGNSHNKPGWGLVSIYGPSYPGVETQWYQHEAFMVELTKRKDPPPRVWRIVNTRTVLKSYSDASFAKLNKKGTKIFFGSAWRQSIKDTGAQYDVYQINLPSTWYKDLMGNLPPTASISATPLSGKPPLNVNFTGSGKDVDGTIVSYSWSFGDGSTSNQQNASHTYETPGNYTVTLKVTDDKGVIGNASVSINVLKSDTTPPAIPTGLKVIK